MTIKKIYFLPCNSGQCPAKCPACPYALMSLSCHLSHVPLPPRNWDPFCNVINAGRASKQESIDAENCASDYPPWPSSHPGLKESERESGLWLPTAKWQRSLDPLSRAVRAKPLMKCLALASTFVERLRDCLHSPACTPFERRRTDEVPVGPLLY